MTEWTLEKEICEIAKKNDIINALHHLGLLTCLTCEFDLLIEEDWKRGGAETYIYRFLVKQKDQAPQHYIVKACVSFHPSRTLSEIIDDWISKRILLEDYAVSAPKLVGKGSGLLIEEYIEYNFSEAIKNAHKKPTKSFDQLLIQLSNYAAAIYKLGFSYVEPYNDLRSRGEDLVAIDFGQDLGSCSSEPIYKAETVYADMISYLTRIGVKLNDQQSIILRQAFDGIVQITDS